MKILVVGLGQIGRRHVRNLKSIDSSIEVGVWSRHATPDELAEFSPPVDKVVNSLTDALSWQPEAAIISNPASLHVVTALPLAEHGIHLFIEKLISNILDGTNELFDLCRQRDLALVVGYNFRFYSPLQQLREALREGRIGRPISLRAEVGAYLPKWRPARDHKQSVSAQSDLGGGAVLELSHELDYARWLMGEVSSVAARVARLGELDINVEDLVEIVLGFENGAVGSVHLDMLQRSPTRLCRIIGTEGTLTWDWSTHNVCLFSGATDLWEDLVPAQDIDRNDMYVAELKHFLDCVSREAVSLCTGEDGRRALEIAVAVKESSATERFIRL